MRGKVSRRLAAIFVADVVGYSRLVEEDEEATLSEFKAHCEELISPAISGHYGRIVKTSGDGILAEFGSVVEATKCAVDIQRGMAERNARAPGGREMLLRIGLNLGDVVIDGDDIQGGGVNIAARLQECAEPGGINVSIDVYRQVEDKLDFAFVDAGTRHLKNIDKPVAVYRIEIDELGVTGGASRARRGVIDVSRPVPGFSKRPAIAVLPFTNMSAKPDDEYFSDGLTEDIITGLSNWRWFPVIARNSTFIYRGQSVDVTAVGAALGARYVLEGSVRARGDQLLVIAQLIEADAARHVWSHRYKRKLEDIFEVQDEIAGSIVAALEPEIEKAEQRRAYSKLPEHLDTWDVVRRGMWHQNKLTRVDASEAKRLFDLALAQDPNSIEALVQLAWWHFWNTWTQRGPSEGWDEMESLARRALVLDDKDYRAHMLIGIALLMGGDPIGARRLLQVSIELNPSQSLAHSSVGTTHILAGEPDRAIKPLETAMRLSPHDLYIFHALGELAVAHYLLGHWEEAIDNAEKSIRLRPGYIYAHITRIGSFVRSAQTDRTANAVRELRRRRPTFSIDDIGWLPFIDSKSKDYLIEGMAMAGFDFSEAGESHSRGMMASAKRGSR